MGLRVGIVGAGISGLAAARTLAANGHHSVLFEKSRSVGGRVATRRSEGFLWDTGATSVAPRGHTIEHVMLNELDGSDLIAIDRPIYVHRGLRPGPGNSGRLGSRFTYRTGNRTLAKLLAAGHDIRLESTISEVGRVGEKFSVGGEEFDAVILTPPIPQTAILLWGLGESRPLAHAQYRACLSVNVGFAAPTPDIPYFALIDVDRGHPLTWLSVESAKSPGRAPENGSAFGAQLSPTFSIENWRRSDEDLVAVTCEFLERLYGADFQTPVASTVMRWKYSQPTGLADFDEVNPVGTRLIVASDGLQGGHVEEAYDVGYRAAMRLLEA